MYFLKSMNQIHIFHQKLKCHRQCPPLGATSGDLNNRKVKQQTFFFFTKVRVKQEALYCK